jgi:hypothetical protein
MTPKEKAQELYSKYLEQLPSNLIFDLIHYLAKQCALIAVDEIINALQNNAANSASWKFYEEVKKEIEAL